MSRPPISIRTATPVHLQAITDIFNETIEKGSLIAQLVPVELSERQAWFGEINRQAFPVFVVEYAHEIAGFLSFSPYRPGRQALVGVAEISYFVGFKYHGLGLGSQLMTHALKQAPILGFKSLIAILLETNGPSIRLLEAFGFMKWATLPEISEMPEGRVGQVYYGKNLW